MPSQCVALGCTNQGGHRFPIDETLRREWVVAMKRENFEPTKDSRLCTDHFLDSDYLIEGFQSGLLRWRKGLKKGAVPSVFPAIPEAIRREIVEKREAIKRKRRREPTTGDAVRQVPISEEDSTTRLPSQLKLKGYKYVLKLDGTFVKMKPSMDSVGIQESNVKGYPKPKYSYPFLIALALKNSFTGSLPLSKIYKFICDHFPYFRAASPGWTQSIRRNLTLNKCFEKKVIAGTGVGGPCMKKGILWALNPEKADRMWKEVTEYTRSNLIAIKRSLRNPDDLERLTRGEMKIGRYTGEKANVDDRPAQSTMIKDEPLDYSEEETEELHEEEIEIPPCSKMFDPLVDPLKLENDPEEYNSTDETDAKPDIDDCWVPVVKTEPNENEFEGRDEERDTDWVDHDKAIKLEETTEEYEE